MPNGDGAARGHVRPEIRGRQLVLYCMRAKHLPVGASNSPPRFAATRPTPPKLFPLSHLRNASSSPTIPFRLLAFSEWSTAYYLSTNYNKPHHKLVPDTLRLQIHREERAHGHTRCSREARAASSKRSRSHHITTTSSSLFCSVGRGSGPGTLTTLPWAILIL